MAVIRRSSVLGWVRSDEALDNRYGVLRAESLTGINVLVKIYIRGIQEREVAI